MPLNRPAMLDLLLDATPVADMPGVLMTALGVTMGEASWEGHARALGATDIEIARVRRSWLTPGPGLRGGD